MARMTERERGTWQLTDQGKHRRSDAVKLESTNATLTRQNGKQDTSVGYQIQKAATPTTSSGRCGTVLWNSTNMADCTRRLILATHITG
jgi:hypothetical protein